MARLIAGAIDGKPFLDPVSMEVSGELDSTGVDSDSTAKINFNDKIQAEIKTAIVNEYTNDLIVESGDSKLEVSQPWHCGQFQDGKSSIKLILNNEESEIPIVDDVGLFTREINDSFEYENKCKLIESMWRIAYADGNVDKYEEHIIRKVSSLIYVAHSDFIQAKLNAK